MRAAVSKSVRPDRRKAQALALGAACAIILVIVCTAFLCLAMFLGGEQELNTASKTGALNVAVQMLNQNTTCSGQFAELSDKNGNVSLNNINMVYAKALMIALNGQDIANSGLSNGNTSADVQSVLQQANTLCRELLQKLQNTGTAQNYFNVMAGNNSVRMFGGTPQVAADPNSTDYRNAWKTAYVYGPSFSTSGKATESNITINSSQLPLSSRATITGQLISKNGMTFLPGYSPLQVGMGTICLIPFTYGGQPRLVGPSAFNNNLTAPASDVTVLPNCWSVVGMERGGSLEGAHTIAYASTNPEKTIPFAMQGYIRITLNPNSYSMESDLEPCGEGQYGYGPMPYEVESTEFEVPICCMGQMQATLNLENEPGDLYSVLFPTSAMNTGQDQVLAVLLQRVNEFCPNCTNTDIITALGEAMTTESQNQTFYLYCSKTGDRSTLTCTSNPSSSYSFMNFNYPADANSTIIAEQEFTVDDPNTAEMEVEPEADCEGWGWAEVECTSSNLSWAPGTGYNGFLGELSLSRTWLVTGEAFCIVIPP